MSADPTEHRHGGSTEGGGGDPTGGGSGGGDPTDGRYTAELDGDFVVFLVGMRFRSVLRVDRWLPVFLAMPRMLRELRSRDRSGLLESRIVLSWRGISVIQYWEDFESLRGYPHDADGEHHPTWMEYDRARGEEPGAVGIWHETFLVRAGEYEAVYDGVPPLGLGSAGTPCPAEGRRRSAAGRLGRTDGDEGSASPSPEAA